MRVAAMGGECMASSLELELTAGRGAQVERIAAYAGGALDDLLLAHGLDSSRASRALLAGVLFSGHLRI
jgi:hypothetical protein